MHATDNRSTCEWSWLHVKMKLLTGMLTTLSLFRAWSCRYHTALTSRCRFPNCTQYAESHNLLFHFMTHWNQRHQSAALLQKASYYFRSVSLFTSTDGTSRELSAHTSTLLVITTFTLEWLTERDDMRMDGLRSLSESGFAYYIKQCAWVFKSPEKLLTISYMNTLWTARIITIIVFSISISMFVFCFVFVSGLKYVGLLEHEQLQVS